MSLSISELVKKVKGKSDLVSSILGWIRSDFKWSLLIIPILFSVLIYSLSEVDYQGWGDRHRFKFLMEIVHPVILATFLLVSLQSWLSTKDTTFIFLTVLSVLVLGRELYGQGAGFVFYPALIGLIVYGSRNPDRIASLLGSKWATSFLGMCFLCYLSSQLLDRGLVKRIGWLIFWDTSWKPPHASNLEESLESLGGLFLLCMSIVVRVNVRVDQFKQGVQSSSANNTEE
jgi:hypothetical protein